MHPIHPMIVHFPIALLITSVVFDLLATRWRPGSFREVSFYTLIAGLLGAVAAVITGSLAEEQVEESGVPGWILELHETLGYATLWLFIGLLALRLLMRWGLLREIPVLRIAMGVVSIGVLAVTGYSGGILVYGFGAGVNLAISEYVP